MALFICINFNYLFVFDKLRYMQEDPIPASLVPGGTLGGGELPRGLSKEELFRYMTNKETPPSLERARPTEIRELVHKSVLQTIYEIEKPITQDRYRSITTNSALQLAEIGIDLSTGSRPDGSSYLDAALGREPVNKRNKAEISNALARIEAFSRFSVAVGQFINTGGSVDKMAGNFTNPTPYTLRTDDFEAIFNYPAVVEEGDLPVGLQDEFRMSPEAVPFGTKIDTAYRLYQLIGLCEKPTNFKALMNSPGAKFIKDGKTDEEIENVLGEWETWSQTNREEETYKSEHRGLLTKHGNIFAREETEDEFKSVHEAIANFVGDRGAQETARYMMEATGEAAELGLETFWKKKVVGSGRATQTINELVVVMAGYPNTSDLVKIYHPNEWQHKKTKNKAVAGTPNTRGKFGRLAVSGFKFMSFEPENLKVGSEDEYKKRSVYEAMWGYGKEGTAVYEKPYRLGEIPWKDIPRYEYRDWMLRVFYAGREKGMFDLMRTEDHDLSAMMSPAFWRGLNETMGVLVGEPLVTGGVYRGKNVSDYKGAIDLEKDRWAGLIIDSLESEMNQVRMLAPVNQFGNAYARISIGSFIHKAQESANFPRRKDLSKGISGKNVYI